uniref:J domain-containing protein n=1 Tax=Kalanchoe fedtschenkoi TaxID=63787 RepID=A0A7N0V519_KALFE
MVTALKILRVAEEPIGEIGSPDWYKILQIEPFSSVNAVRKRYKKLALALHPDKSSFVGCGDAFKLVADAFRCLDDRERKKEFDLKLRVRIQDERMRREEEVVERFWTRCVGCGMLHRFERKYVGQNLMCTGCRKSFMAVEIEGNDDSDITLSDKEEEEEEEEDEVEEGKENEVGVSGPDDRDARASQNWKGKIIVYSRRKVSEKSSEASDVRRCNVSQKSSRGEIRSERLKAKRMKLAGEEMTLAELQLQAKQRRKVVEKKTVEKTVADKSFDSGKRKEKELQLQGVCLRGGSHEHVRHSVDLIHETRNGSKKSDTANVEQECEEDVLWLSALKKKKADIAKAKSTSKKRGRDVEDVASGRLEGGNFEIMTVEDSDFYDFDKDRVEKSFKQGQVWAVYDDEDGMPRHYGLIDQVVSTNPFEVKMSWLDRQTNSYEMLPISATSQSRVSCGRFKVDKKTVINSVNFFSHVVNCDRAAREVYSIYPKKGSVWALYNDEDMDIYGREGLPNRSFSIVIFLTSYSEMHGLSMAYLKKVNGLKTVFRRPEIGCGAVIWLEKVDVRLFSHQIPARKLSEVEAPKHLKDCWELDPASLPHNLLTSGWER